MIIKINIKKLLTQLVILAVLITCIVQFATPQSLKADSKKVEDTTVKLPVAMYHHILKDTARLGDYVISPTQFEEDLKYIQKSGYQTISTTELLEFIEQGTPLPEKPILITFDDGYESVHEYAYPLLKKYDMKAVVAIIGKHTDVFSKEEQGKHINYSHLSWNQLREMQQSGVFEIQNHSYDMHGDQSCKRFGTKIKRGESEEQYNVALEKDVGGLSQQIEREIGIKPILFAYPFGIICKESKPILKELGFKIILSCEEKVNKLKSYSDTPIYLKRYNRASRYSTFNYFKKMGVE